MLAVSGIGAKTYTSHQSLTTNTQAAYHINADTISTDTDALISDTTYSDTLSIDSVPALPWPQNVQARIDTLIGKSSFLRSSQLGLMVYDLTADSVIYAHNERQTLRPASTMKLLTAITALDCLGGDYRYKTRLMYTGNIVDSLRTLEGDIYIIGGMDPRLGSDDLRSFVQALQTMDIDTIRGHFYTDRSMKDDNLLGEGWCWDDDNPVLSPLVFGRKDNLSERFLAMLEENGIYLDGETKTGTCPTSDAKELVVRTHTIEQILQRMMKQSDNLYAESMLYQIGLKHGRPSTARKARQDIEAILKKIGLSGRPHRFADGSGLSLYNYVSAEIEVGFLRYAWDNADIYSNLRPSLPIAGVDGTLEKRMRKTPAEHNVHAKTGTLSGISSLAGYCTAANGHELCFAIINQGVMKSAPAKQFQDRLCVDLCSE